MLHCINGENEGRQCEPWEQKQEDKQEQENKQCYILDNFVNNINLVSNNWFDSRGDC